MVRKPFYIYTGGKKMQVLQTLTNNLHLLPLKQIFQSFSYNWQRAFLHSIILAPFTAEREPGCCSCQLHCSYMVIFVSVTKKLPKNNYIGISKIYKH